VVTPLLSSSEDSLIANPFYENKLPGNQIVITEMPHVSEMVYLSLTLNPIASYEST
jgi:hypothetical protein